ncbi:hypothetical protein ILUMI_15612 [Ignelater luminosus]|uniref:Uncharacterized protein n=1 Tax=Ignelater luminosus TaxID=2038154 RepID=A0A8K0CSP7_IGNLU|nr:hypothetical protein ILUMI_15612 [Ignelater luminosus]
MNLADTDFIKEKSDVPEKLKLMLAEADAAGYHVKELLSDNSREFDSNAARLILTMSYIAQQNPCERENRSVVEAARTYMHLKNN